MEPAQQGYQKPCPDIATFLYAKPWESVFASRQEHHRGHSHRRAHHLQCCLGFEGPHIGRQRNSVPWPNGQDGSRPSLSLRSWWLPHKRHKYLRQLCFLAGCKLGKVTVIVTFHLVHLNTCGIFPNPSIESNTDDDFGDDRTTLEPTLNKCTQEIKNHHELAKEM